MIIMGNLCTGGVRVYIPRKFYIYLYKILFYSICNICAIYNWWED